MQTQSERRELPGDHIVRARPKGLIDWEGAHLFLELVRQKSFRATADHLGISFNAVRTRIGAFERSLGVTLITRHVDGIRLTEEGEEILEAVTDMERAAFALVQSRDQTVRSVAGEVKLAVTEGLGTLWIATHLVEFQRANPKLLLDINCAMRSPDVLRLEADISVQLTRPTAKDLRVVKLGRLHFMPFAAQSYLDLYGTPTQISDYPNHRVLLQADDVALWRKMYDQVFPNVDPEGLVTLRTNVSSAHYWSIVQGAGIGLLPTYVYAVGAPIVPLELGIHVPVDIWMTYHPSAARIPRVRRLADWLIATFSPKICPWFADEFIPPEELLRRYNGGTHPNPYAGLMHPAKSSK
jgi:DNA-binding transcriptional LysR family regulator